MMGIFSACGKFILRSFNDSISNHEKKKVHTNSYARTGKQIQKAKKTGTRINGSKVYQREKRKELQNIQRRHRNRENFINDL